MSRKLTVVVMSCALGAFSIVGCNSEKAPDSETIVEEQVDSKERKVVGADVSGNITPSIFGEEIEVEEVTSAADLLAGLETSDTLRDIVIGGKIASVCKKKGCWMNVQLGEEKEVFVKFKDYGFFVPLDSDGSNAVLQGNAYKETVSVEELKHYAEDDGQSEEEIAAITEPETKYLFMASGVILTDYVSHKQDMKEKVEADGASAAE